MFSYPRPVAEPLATPILGVRAYVWHIILYVCSTRRCLCYHWHRRVSTQLWCPPLCAQICCVCQWGKARPCLCTDIISDDSPPGCPSNVPMVLMCVSCWQLRQRDYGDCGEGTRKEQLIMPVNSRALLHVQGHEPSLSLSPCRMTRAMTREREGDREGVMQKSSEDDIRKRDSDWKLNNTGVCAL